MIIAKCFNESDKFFGTYDFFLQIPEMPLLLVLLNILRRPLYILSSMNSWKKGMNMQLCSTHGDAAQGVKYFGFFLSFSQNESKIY